LLQEKGTGRRKEVKVLKQGERLKEASLGTEREIQ